MKRLQIKMLIIASITVALGCCIMTWVRLFPFITHNHAIPGSDLYWFYFGVIPNGITSNFDISHYMLLLLPGTISCYLTSNHIQTHMIEAKYSVLIRYHNISKWILDNWLIIIFKMTLFYLVFHGSFSIIAVLLAHRSSPVLESIFLPEQLGIPLLLLIKQICLMNSLSSVLLLLSLHHNLQTGIIAALICIAIAVLSDILSKSSINFYCADACLGSFIPVALLNILIFVIVLMDCKFHSFENFFI